MAAREPFADQLVNFKKSIGENVGFLTTKSGNPIENKTAILTAGEWGLPDWQDVSFMDEMSSFTREKIPERVVHAKGAGAFGYFEVTHDIKKYTAAKLFDTIGKRTPLVARFSTVAGESGSADTVRDPRGFAVKFYTEDGIWDMAGNNTPIFFIRDAHLFPSFVHTQKRNPETHCKDPDMFWDFMTLQQECTHQMMLTYSDRGIPDGFRHMNGYGSHTYTFVNAQGVSTFVKFHFKTEQGIKNLPVDKAAELVSSEPDYAIKDLFNSIARGQHPAWRFYIQTMTEDQANTLEYNPFDMTKIWSQKEYPLIPVGRMVLDKNPKNYFADVEQVAFDPAHLIPGIGSSPDKMLQARLFAYGDTHRHRLGANHLQIPVNCPYRNSIFNYQRDGPQNVTENQKGAPNYFPNSFGGPVEDQRTENLAPKIYVSGLIDRYEENGDDDFRQSGIFYREVLKAEERDRLVTNIVNHLKEAAHFIQERAIENFNRVDPEFGCKVAKGLASHKKHYAKI